MRYAACLVEDAMMVSLQVIVRAAGHIVPGDQPERAYDMIQRFIKGTPYDSFPDPA